MTENRSQPDYSGRYYLVLAGFVLLVLMLYLISIVVLIHFAHLLVDFQFL